MIICAGQNETFPFATSIGVGLIESAINLTQICLFNKPKYLLFIGSAGSYGNYNILDIVQSRSASNIELSFLNNDCYTPLDNVLKSDNKLVKDETIVNSSNYISTNQVLSKDFTSYNLGIENMEFYSILKVAEKFDIDVGGIFVITNYTNQEAHKVFINNHKKAMDKLITFLEEKKIIVSRETL